MGAQFIPGPDFSGLARLGAGIGKILNPNREREEQIQEFFLQNPIEGAQFAAAQRELERQFEANPNIGDASVDIPVPNVLEQLDIDRDKTLQILAAFPESGQERLEQARQRAGLSELQVRSEVATLNQNIAESGYRQKLTTALDERGIPELAATQAAAEAVLGAELSQFQQNYLSRWRLHLEGLKDSNPFEYRRALAAMNSPEFLRDLQFRESLALQGRELDVRGRLAEIEAAQGSADRDIKIFGLTLDAQENLDTQLDRLQEALKGGEEADKELAIDRVNEAAALVRAVSPPGATFDVDPERKTFFSTNIKGIRFTRLAPGTLSVPLAVQYEGFLNVFESATGEVTFEELQQQLVQSRDGTAFLGELTAQERTKFFSDAQQLFKRLESAEGQEVTTAEKADIARRETAVQTREDIETSISSIESEIAEVETELAAVPRGESGQPRAVALRRRMSRLRLDLAKKKSERSRGGIPRRIP